MLVHVPDHFSTKLKFNLDKVPASVTDRSGLKWILSGWFFGVLMLWLGIFELFSFLTAEKNINQSFMVVEIFAFMVILIALGLIVYSFFSFVRCKKFYFDGREFHVIYRPAVGVKHQFREPIEHYIGVRLRVLFVQSGIFNKNRYIVDLYHPDSNKIVPLYISTSNKNIRKIWESYARLFQLPVLSVGDIGLVQRDYEDLDKSVKELAQDSKIPFIVSGKLPAPSSLNIEEKRGATQITPKRFYWDTFSAFALCIYIAIILILIGTATFMFITGHFISSKSLLIWLVLICVTLYFIIRLFNSYTLVITSDKIVVNEVLLGIFVKKNEIRNDVAESIELSYDPTTSRYKLAIISDDKTITLGSRLPVSDLLWLKDFVIRKLIGN